jgi:hypothetical protein
MACCSSVIHLEGRRIMHIGSAFRSRVAIETLDRFAAILFAPGIFFVLRERPCMNPTWPSILGDRISRWFAAGLIRAAISR